MERIIVYPTLIWAIVFGGYLMAMVEAVLLSTIQESLMVKISLQVHLHFSLQLRLMLMAEWVSDSQPRHRLFFPVHISPSVHLRILLEPCAVLNWFVQEQIFTIELSKGILLEFGFFVGKILFHFRGHGSGLSDKLSALLAVGTTICGGSAIAITSPLIKAKEEETSYAVSVIVISAFILMVVMLFLGNILGMSETAFGVWAGT